MWEIWLEGEGYYTARTDYDDAQDLAARLRADTGLDAWVEFVADNDDDI